MWHILRLRLFYHERECRNPLFIKGCRAVGNQLYVIHEPFDGDLRPELS